MLKGCGRTRISRHTIPTEGCTGERIPQNCSERYQISLFMHERTAVIDANGGHSHCELCRQISSWGVAIFLCCYPIKPSGCVKTNNVSIFYCCNDMESVLTHFKIKWYKSGDDHYPAGRQHQLRWPAHV